MKNKYYPLSWNDYHKLVFKLAGKIIAKGHNFDKIVGISRCGLTLGHLLSDLLFIPVSIISMKSYEEINMKKKPKFIEGFNSSISGKKILLVDGISDTGETLRYSINYLKKRMAKSIITATIFSKPKTSLVPDLFVETSDRWITFPYETVETFLGIKKTEGNKNQNDKGIIKRLKQFKYSNQQLEFIKKHYLK